MIPISFGMVEAEIYRVIIGLAYKKESHNGSLLKTTVN
jgi:hypothetical protein